MSIEDEIADRCQRGMLFPIWPKAAGDIARRSLFVGERLWDALNSPEGDAEWERRIGELQADLEQFITNEFIAPRYLFLLFPKHDRVWEIRSVAPDPSIRVLGMFAQKDVLVLVEHALREDLGGWQSPEWIQIKRNVGASWRVLFEAYVSLNAITVDDVVSGAIDGRFFKG